MRSLNALMGADPAHDRLHYFETSWLFSPPIFATLRLVIALYCLLTILIIFSSEGVHGSGIIDVRSFSYFTNLSFAGVQWYFLVAGIHTVFYACTGRSVLFDKWPRWLRSTHSLFYTTIVCYPFVVAPVYWAMLYKGPWYPVRYNAWSNVSRHALTPVFALFEIIFSTVPPPPLLHFPFLVIILALYTGVAYITHATQGTWVYPFLNPGPHNQHSGRVAAYLFGVIAIQLLAFVVVWLISYARMRLVSSKKTKWAKGDEGALAAPGGRANGDAEMAEEAMEIHLDLDERK
ncbi:hypothetical protein AJ78_02406 [Emergomyces pasteurianus Ep9510]|uniref:FAR-17a/AIG1-like protein n=1 Tax=Emergomyces pasteurianus Ep9510 TaxID=1447872 RepID=A0A1J9QQF4_9EURO|nr:hypothetical protein AJ78_02406 [Emergomyces pasteurianus Ep9510]